MLLYEGTMESKTYLSDSILALDDGQNTLLLNWRRLNETVAIDSSEYSFFEAHVVEAFYDLFPVGLELFFIYMKA